MKNKILANKRVPFSFFVILVISNLALLALVAWLINENKERILPFMGEESTPTPSMTNSLAAPQLSQTPTTQVSTSVISTPENTATFDAQNIAKVSDEGFMILSMPDGIHSHLFLYHPQYIPVTRLWNENWDDITPAISPDGTQLVFSSNRNGYWDLYLYDFTNGSISRITDTTGYDGSPSWSPDGEWITFESYIDDNLEIYIQSINDPSQPAIRLTEDPATDFSPSWSPNGRQIAFVSTRGGEEDIWIANLDDDNNRFINISQNTVGQDTFPAWSPDGKRIAWTSDEDGLQTILVKNITENEEISALGPGSMPVWSPSGDSILCSLNGPNQDLIGGYAIENGEIVIPFQKMNGEVSGLDWEDGDVVALLSHITSAGPSGTPTSLWSPVLDVNPNPPSGRYGVVQIQDVNVANPYLHDLVDESFTALRKDIAQISGWDFLGNLESAYQPITSPSPPDMVDNWLYTGRAFAVNPLPISANWMVVVREDYSGQTYWRIFIKARYQDGSQGLPLKNMIWDLSARFAGEPRAYEDGGKYQPVPEGYWIDFTEFALRYGWERLPALINWRTYYQGTRYNLFVMTDNLTWSSAMAQLYPPEAMMTITYVPTPTREVLFTATPTPTTRPTYTSVP